MLDNKRVEQDVVKDWNAKRQLDDGIEARTQRWLSDLDNEVDGNKQDFIVTASPMLIAIRRVVEEIGIKSQQVKEKSKGINLKSLDKWQHADLIGRLSGLPSRKVQLSGNWYENNCQAILGFWGKESKPVALLPGDGFYTMFDPTDETEVRLNDTDYSNLDASGIMFYKSLPAKKIAAKDFLQFCFSLVKKRDIVIYAVSLLVSGILGLILPKVTGTVFSEVIPQVDVSQLVIIGLLLFCVAISQLLIKILQIVATSNMEGMWDIYVKSALYDRMINLRAAFFSKSSVSGLTMRLQSEAAIRNIFSTVLSGGVSVSVYVLASAVMMFYFNPPLAGLVIVIIVAYMLISTWKMVKVTREIWSTIVKKMSGKMFNVLYQGVNGITAIRIFGAEKRLFAHWAIEFKKIEDIRYELAQANNKFNQVTQAVKLLVLIVIYLLISTSETMKMSPPIFIAFNTAFVGFIAGLSEMQSSAILLFYYMNFNLKFELSRYLDAVPEVAAGGQLLQPTGKIDLERIKFSYQKGGRTIIDGLSVHINEGEFVAFVGPSGCGKSTILRLLLGFEEPDAGLVMYDNIELKDIDVRELRNHCGVVLQNGELFSDSIYNNIAAMSGRSLDDAWLAAEQAGIAEEIRKMPMGMHTLISEGGANLSGGQRQRIFIARALVNQPKIIFFDEATSALDGVSQSIVMDTMSRLKITKVVIAQRLGTIKNADSIYVLQDGKVVEKGTFKELCDKKGLFYDMAQRQIA